MASTYSQIIDDILVEIPEAGNLTGLADEWIQGQINRAQNQICIRIPVVGVTTIKLTLNDEDVPIPKNINRINHIDRLEGNFRRTIKPMSLFDLLELRRLDGVGIYTNFDTPYAWAEFWRDGTRFLKFYPVSDAVKDIDLHGTKRHDPHDFNEEELTTPIQLPEIYDEAIKHFVKSQMFEWLRKEDDTKYRLRRDEEFAFFREELQQLRKNMPIYSSINVSYK